MGLDNENEKDLGHECEEGCDCGHEHDTVFITFEDDNEVECNIIAVFPYEEKDYIALNPVDDEEVLIYRYTETEDGDMKIEFIDSDAEYSLVTEAFYELVEQDDSDEEYMSDEELDDIEEESDEDVKE